MELIIKSNQMEEVAGVSAEYPFTLNLADSRDTRVSWHWHEELEFDLVVRGTLKVMVSGQTYLLGAGDGCFINSNVLHTMEPLEDAQGACWYVPMFHPTLLGGHYKSVFDMKYLAPVLKNKNFEICVFRGEIQRQKEILALLHKLIAVQDQENREFHTRNLISDAWLLLMEEMKVHEQGARFRNPVNQERIQTMLAYIHENYQQKLSLDQIAASAIVSRRECLRCFQSSIQKTPFAYLLDYRVQMAERLLRTSNLTITEIALQTGFSNSAYFTKVFRELRGVAPSQYRKNCT